MTLRQKIILLGLTAIVGMALALWRQYAFHAAELDSVRTMTRNLEAVGALSAVVHELQRERGVVTYTLAGTTPTTTLAEEIRRTDIALENLAETGRMPRGFAAALAHVRREIHADATSTFGVRDDYSALLSPLIDEMTRLARAPALSLAGDGDDIAAHAHLVAMKEYLGQARATLVFWLATPHDGRAAFDSLIRIKSLLDEAWRKFELEASPPLRSAFRERFAGLEVEAAQEALQAVLTTGAPPAGLDARTWFTVASGAIDRLFEVENRSLDLIQKRAATRRAELHRELAFGTLTMAITAVFVLILAVSAIASLLRALSRTLSGMEQIAASRDFRSRIPVDAHDEIGRIARSFNALLDVAERLLHEKEYLAATDPLTGISNRLRFAQVLEEEARRKQRNRTPMALVIFDVDRFKNINDTHGHECGDQVLKQLARLVKDEIRAGDFLARWGGEEFILLLRDDNCEGAFATAEKLRKLIAAATFPGAGRLTCSFGLTSWNADDTPDGLVSRADRALYASKHSGRDRVTCEHSGSGDCPGTAACIHAPPPAAAPAAILQ